jgi:hypothetical protein
VMVAEVSRDVGGTRKSTRHTRRGADDDKKGRVSGGSSHPWRMWAVASAAASCALTIAVVQRSRRHLGPDISRPTRSGDGMRASEAGGEKAGRMPRVSREGGKKGKDKRQPQDGGRVQGAGRKTRKKRRAVEVGWSNKPKRAVSGRTVGDVFRFCAADQSTKGRGRG